MAVIEPWLRGPLPNVSALAMPLSHSFLQVREDLNRYINSLSEKQIWRAMPGGSLGFHLQHLAGSLDRLTTYLGGGQLSDEQAGYLHDEARGSQGATELLACIDRQLTKTEAVVAELQVSVLFEPRYVGRHRLPTTVLGLIVHIAEHTQRHLGQSITLAHLLRRDG